MIELSNGAEWIEIELHRVQGDGARGHVLYRVEYLDDRDCMYGSAVVWVEGAGDNAQVIAPVEFDREQTAQAHYDNRRGAVPLPFHREEAAGVHTD